MWRDIATAVHDGRRDAGGVEEPRLAAGAPRPSGLRSTSALLVVAAAMTAAALGAAQPGPSGAGDPPANDAFAAETLDFGLPPLDDPRVLSTPQGALELFVGRAAKEDWSGAAHALNLSLEDDLTPDRAAELARRLDSVMRSEIAVDWSSVPDTPDGATVVDGRWHGPRRTVFLGQAALGDRSVPLNLQRFEGPDGRRRWLLSPFAVEHVDALYRRHGAGWLESRVPGSWRQLTVGEVAVWEWVAIGLFLLVSVVVGRTCVGVVRRLRSRSHGYLRVALSAGALPLGVLSAVLTAYLGTARLLTPSGPVASGIDTALFTILVLVAAWTGIRVLGRLTDEARRRYQGVLSDDHLRGRRLKTQLSVAHRVFVTLVAIVVLGIALSNFSLFSSLSISLLASAGVLTVLIGIAAQPVLGNLTSGIQIAATEPLRIGDMIRWGDAFGWVEDITFTFVVLRNWDDRRLIIPHSEILSKTFENWSKNDESMTREVWLYVDPMADVGAVRSRFKELVEADDRWDGRINQLDVRAMSERAIHLRGLVSAAHPRAVWDLHMDLRDQMVAYLQELHRGRSFSRARLLHQEEPEGTDRRPFRPAASGEGLNDARSDGETG